MTVKDAVQGTIQKLESLCDSYAKSPVDELEKLEETVSHLSCEVQHMDIAADQTLKHELSTLKGALSKLSSLLEKQQDKLNHQVQEINLHQKALDAFSKVANNNGEALA